MKRRSRRIIPVTIYHIGHMPLTIWSTLNRLHTPEVNADMVMQLKDCNTFFNARLGAPYVGEDATTAQEEAAPADQPNRITIPTSEGMVRIKVQLCGIEGAAREFAREHLEPKNSGEPMTAAPECGSTHGQENARDAAADRRTEIITSMCMTMRHDYGLHKKGLVEGGFIDSITCGMTDEARQGLFNQMAQLYDHHVAPVLKDLDDQKKQAVGWERASERLQRQEAVVTEQRGRLSHALIMQGSEATQERNKITDKLHLKPGTPIEVVLDTIQSIQQQAKEAQSRKEGLQCVIPRVEYDRLLAIERGHQQNKEEARLARINKNDIDVDLVTFAQEVGFMPATTSAGRKEMLRAIAAHIGSMESEINNLQERNDSLVAQLGPIGAALKRAGIDEGAPEHVRVTDLANRYLQASKPVYGPSPLAALFHQYQLLSESEQERLKATQTIRALRTIVRHHAPHAPGCQIARTGIAPCGCWKAEFMTETEDYEKKS